MAEDRKLGHRILEAVHHKLLLIDKALPEACRAVITGECKVGLETQLAGVGSTAERERRSNLARVVGGSGEADALKQNLEEDLSVEGEWSLFRGISQ